MFRSMKDELAYVGSSGSCLRVISGAFGTGKSFSLRALQEYAHKQGFATSFLTLSSRECPMYDLKTVYRHIVKGIRVSHCHDRPAFEEMLRGWLQRLQPATIRRKLSPSADNGVDQHFKRALLQYYEGIQSVMPERSDLALRWLCGETTLREARRLGIAFNTSSQDAPTMMRNLTRLVRLLGWQGLAILVDEADAIPVLPTPAKREAAYANLRTLAKAASTTPHSCFAYAATMAFFDTTPEGFNGSLDDVVELDRLKGNDLSRLARGIRDMHFQAHQWNNPDFDEPTLRRFVSKCTRNSVRTPRDFVITMVTALDNCQENDGLTLDEVTVAGA